MDGQIDRQIDRQTHTYVCIYIYRQTGRLMDISIDRQTGDAKVDVQIDRKIHGNVDQETNVNM